MWLPLAATEPTPLATCTGVLLYPPIPVPPPPSWPLELLPTVHNVASVFTNIVLSDPAATDATSLATCVGVFWGAVVMKPVPNCPDVLRPMAHKVRSVFTNIVCT